MITVTKTEFNVMLEDGRLLGPPYTVGRYIQAVSIEGGLVRAVA